MRLATRAAILALLAIGILATAASATGTSYAIGAAYSKTPESFQSTIEGHTAIFGPGDPPATITIDRGLNDEVYHWQGGEYPYAGWYISEETIDGDTQEVRALYYGGFLSEGTLKEQNNSGSGRHKLTRN